MIPLYNEFNSGSKWRKWDLHIHTPLSISQQYGGIEKWDDFIVSLESLPEDVKVIGINDYYFIDGYEKVMKAKFEGRLKNIEKIFPVLEFRIDTFGSGNENSLQKINLHIIFNLDESKLEDEIKRVKREFIEQIPVTKLDIHKTKNLSLENLKIEGGNNLQAGFSDLIPSTEKVFELLDSPVWKDKHFLLLGYKEWSNLEKNNQLKPLKEDLYKKVSAFFTSNFETLSKSQIWLNEFGNKPLLHSCDIHGFDFLDTAQKDKDGNPIKSIKYNCNTWIKADTTFAGLQQIDYEPIDRVKIQTLEPDSKNDRFLISYLEFSDSSGLFGHQKILLNKNLNAIIGGKSSGKSLLLYSIARSIDPEQVDKTSKRLNFEGYKFKDEINFKVVWQNGDEDTLVNSINSEKLHKITYIPQLYINYLAEKNNKEELNNLIRSILLQDLDFRISYEDRNNSINEKSSEIERLLNDFLKQRTVALEVQRNLKEIGNSATIKSGFEKIENEILVGQKLSSLNENEFNIYNSLLKEKSELENSLRILTLKENTLLKIDKDIQSIKDTLFGRLEHSNGIYLKGQIPRTLDELGSPVPQDMLLINQKLEFDYNQIIENFRNEIKKLDFVDRKQALQKEIKGNANLLDPYIKKLSGQKEIQKLIKQLEDEKNKFEKALALEGQFKMLRDEYEKIRKQTATLLKQRQDLYLQIEEEINQSRNNIGSDISLNCKLIYKTSNFLLYDQVNKSAINNDHFFKEFINDDIVNYNLINGFYEMPLRVNDEKLFYSSTDYIPLKTKVSFEDILRGLIKDNFQLDYTVTYRGDNLLQMSPGKKGTVLLILFLQISSSEFPILIDQPEDNLDNRTIYDLLCKIIKERKKERQIIIVSHNANLVVATDAENIIVANQKGQSEELETAQYQFEYINGSLEYTKEKNNKIKSILNCQGIREHVCDILEGGGEAFKLREKKYSLKMKN